MSNIIAIQSQSQTDLAIQQYGTLESVVQVAFENQLSITDDLTAGEAVATVVYEDSKDDIANYYAKKQIRPATAITAEVEEIIANEDSCNYCKCFT